MNKINSYIIEKYIYDTLEEAEKHIIEKQFDGWDYGNIRYNVRIFHNNEYIRASFYIEFKKTIK